MPTIDKPKVGDVRTLAGVKFTATKELTAWNDPKRVIGLRWNPGAIGHSVDEVFAKDVPFECCGIHSETFEKAAIRSLKRRAAEYRKALDTVAAYEAPELAEQRAAVDRLG
jgi:hypothetical protein